MRIFKSKIKTCKEINEITKSLNSLILKPSDDIFFFPFSIFQKKFYKHIRENRHAYYSGIVNQKRFEFIKEIQYGNISSGSITSRILRINGQINDDINSANVTFDFISPTYEIIIRLIIIVGCLFAYTLKDNKLFLVIPILLILEYSWHILRNYWIIRKTIKY